MEKLDNMFDSDKIWTSKSMKQKVSKSSHLRRSNINSISLLIILSFEMKVLSSVIESHLFLSFPASLDQREMLKTTKEFESTE